MKTGQSPVYGDAAVHEALSLRDSSFGELNNLLKESGYEQVECRKLPSELTREEFDYDNWYVLMGAKPVDEMQKEERGMAAYWDSSALTYDARHDLYDESRWVEVLSSLVGEDRDLRILDVATGTGLISNYLASSGYTQVVACDISEKMMRVAMARAEERGNAIEFVYGNTLDLPFEDESFDVVINSRLLWTLTDPDKAISQWHRVLKPGGRVVAINELGATGIEVNLEGEYERKTGSSCFPFAEASREEIIRSFEEGMFSDVSARPMEGCRMKSSECENWFAFVGIKL